MPLYDIIRKLIILVAGILIVLTGIAMIILPGPAFVVIPVGLALLATEFVWAKWLLRRFQKYAGASADFMERQSGGWIKMPQWVKKMLHPKGEVPPSNCSKPDRNDLISLPPPRTRTPTK